MTVVLPTLMASDATTKNQLPDIDIIMFQISCGIANGTSMRQNAIHDSSIATNRNSVVTSSAAREPAAGGSA